MRFIADFFSNPLTWVIAAGFCALVGAVLQARQQEKERGSEREAVGSDRVRRSEWINA